jgi:protein-disulfide isomerase
MQARFGTAVLALALFTAGCGDKNADNGSTANPTAAVAPIPAPNGGDWTQVVSETAEGGFRMGNPDAPVKLLEYASYTCPHCREFAEQAKAPLTEMVKSGRVSWEFRPFMLFPTDPGITLLVRCQGPEAAFMLGEQIYAEQQQWVGRLQALSEAQTQQIQSLPREQQIGALVKAAQLDQFFRQRGMPEAKINSCLADQKELQKVADITQTGTTKYNVQGTPTFFINGDLVPDASGWDRLRPALNRALGQ